MPKAMLTMTASPFRMLNKADAAHYCGLPASRFETLCPVPPVELASGTKRWDLRDLDRWLDSLKSADDSSDDALLSRLE